MSAQRQYASINIHQNLCNSRTCNFIDIVWEQCEKADWNLHLEGSVIKAKNNPNRPVSHREK